MTRNLEIFGTDHPPTSRRFFTCGPISFSLEDGALRHIKLEGVEAIRGIAFLVRDRDWGTLVPTISNEVIDHSDAVLNITFRARYESQDAQLDVDVKINVADSLEVSAIGHATDAFETNRAGFTVLHPITGVAGQPVRVGHSDGSFEASQFPALIAPWQPFMDITSLAHQAGKNLVTCKLSGDIFEMEDQRQWGDASFKTYNRPLAKPWPYKIDDGEILEQSVKLTWEAAEAVTVQAPSHAPQSVQFPEMALVITPEDARRLATTPSDLNVVQPQRLLCHLDATLGDTAEQFHAFSAAQMACPDTHFDLELICACAPDPAPELMLLAAQMARSKFRPASVLVCPSVDRQSTPPGSVWPECPPLNLIYSAARKAFPAEVIGGGVVSFFPELNRKRPPVEQLDFVSHCLCPIVHAADDISIVEALETIPHITRSARAIIGDRPYRIGPATIAMRQNPYGARTIPNPDNLRTCMAHDDPRHSAKFGAVYAIGLATALATAGIAVWTPASLYGPRGVIPDHGSWPITDVLKRLSTLAGGAVQSANNTDGIARLVVDQTKIVANLTDTETNGIDPFEWHETSLSNPYGFQP